jgi:zinc transport system substrate-binding protein
MRHFHAYSRAALAAALLGGACAASAADGPAADARRPLRVVATIFPAYDWVREIVGTNAADVQLTLLLDDGVDLHSYQPTAADLKTVAESDLFIHVGGESDGWVEPALAAAPNPRRKVLNLVKALGDAAKPEEIVEGMEHHHDHGDDHGDKDHDHDAKADKDHDDDHDHDHDHDEDHDHEEEIDEHVWLSLRHASTLVQSTAEALAALAPARADAFRANAAAYRRKLAALDADYAAAVAAVPRKTLVVADRFPLRYLADDYGLSYFAAFSGCSAETEASFKTVAFLAGKADALGAGALLALEGANHRIAETVRAATKAKNQRIVVFDSLQSTTAARAAAGETYLVAMRRNLAALAEALK